MSNIEPCPLCTHHVSFSIKDKAVYCSRCQLFLYAKPKETAEELINRWNKRALRFKGGLLHIRSPDRLMENRACVFTGQGDIKAEKTSEKEIKLSWEMPS